MKESAKFRLDPWQGSNGEMLHRSVRVLDTIYFSHSCDTADMSKETWTSAVGSQTKHQKR